MPPSKLPGARRVDAARSQSSTGKTPPAEIPPIKLRFSSARASVAPRPHQPGQTTVPPSIAVEPVGGGEAGDRAQLFHAPQHNSARETARPVRRSRKPRRKLPRFRKLVRGLIQWLIGLFTNWKFLILLGFLVSNGSSALALAFILQLPGLPNCPAVFWPLASASMRFECARIAASKQTAKDLLEAIALVDGLPSDHPMRPEANRLIELWSQEVLKLAEELFHKGKLDEAIAAARKIPAKATAHKLIEERVKRWQTIWSKAEGIYRKAEAALRKRDWKLAFQMAVQLLELDNKYWQTTKYDQLNTLINISREDGNKLYEAERLAEWGGLTNLLKAIKLADEIRPQSYVYQLAQQAIQKFGRKMMDFAQVALDRRNLSEALDIVSQIPKKAKLEEEVRDFTVLANAQSRVWQDTVVGLEAAISQAQRLRPGRPLYTKAQQLIARWQAEIEGVAQLERARSLAQGGTVGDLLAAISAASLVSSTNPRWNEAQSEMQKWQTEAETIEDRPILDIADQYASRGDMNALQAAIAQASQVSTGRSLYPEAQGKINQWTRQIQQIQDQPYLDQARAYAAAGNLQAAINVAERIRPGRALYNEAQADVSSWSRQIRTEVARVQAQAAQAQAQQNLQNARQAASSGQPNGLANAIQIASQVSTSGAVQTEIDAAINEWSWQLLSIAKDQAGLNPAGAIAIAQKIPSRAAAHAEAQSQIQIWKQSMKQ